ncbi:MAG: AAA domain-containing protein [Gammaproteobacteria bacterium]|nr:AAA domain-containing protein [Gammaproteobacteria bacterium]
MEAVHDLLHDRVHAAIAWLESRIVGQQTLIRRLVMALLCDGHLLVEGAPGLAKTRAIRELARTIEGSFHRIQFTPDLLPSDVTGTEVINTDDGTFTFRKGPVFHNLLLADEVNRAPAKVQAALLEAMAERQVSYGRETFPLPDLFLVMATQNPIEQEGTYPLPEAQLDRFLLHVTVGYPDAASEREILHLARSEQLQPEPPPPPTPLSQQDIAAARRAIADVFVAPAVEGYIVALVEATRVDPLLEYGASPRGTIALDRCARAVAWLDGRDFATPGDVAAVAPDVLRHRLITTFDAQARGIDADAVLTGTLETVPAP